MNHDPSAELPRHDEDAPEEGVPAVVAQDEARGPDEERAAAPRSPAVAALDSLSKDELIDRHLRLLADQRRMRQRAELDLNEARREAKERVVLGLLSVLDSVERGLEAAGDGEEQNPWREGMEGIHRQMLDELLRLGVEPFEPTGPFDASFMEALCTMPALDKEDGTVAHVERKGYRTAQGVLRPARVVVVRNE
jgi:molecular chaperone GrpE